MKSAYITKLGAPGLITVGDLPTPTAGPHQVLVKVQAVTVDPVDTYIRSGKYKIDVQFPFIIGRDMVGTVYQTGSAVTRFKTGDRVWCNNQGYAGRQGTFAEFLAIDEDLLYPIPPQADPHNLVLCVHSALTACVGLIGKAHLRRNETLFVNGGSGNVGLCAIQLAKHLGAKVAVTAGSPEKREWCNQSGADLVIDYKHDDIAKALASFSPEGIDVFWDLTLQPDVRRAVERTAHRGRILLSSGLLHVSEMPVGAFYTHNLTMFGFTITDLSVQELRQYADLLNDFFAQHVFKAHITSTMTLDDAANAHQLVEEGVNGKLLITVS